MQQTSELYKQILQNPNHWFESSLSIGEKGHLLDHKGNSIVFGIDDDGTNLYIATSIGGAESGFNDSMLISINTSRKLFADDVPQCGCAIASEIDVEMLAPLTEVPRKAKLVPYVRATDGTNYSEWIQKGVYFVDTRETSVGLGGQNILTMHGYDRMVEMDIDFPSVDLSEYINPDTDVVTDRVILNIISDKLEIDIEENTLNNIVVNGYEVGLPLGYSVREVLQQIAAAYVGNFIINDSGALKLVQINAMPRETNILIDEFGNQIVFGIDPEEEPQEVKILV